MQMDNFSTIVSDEDGKKSKSKSKKNGTTKVSSTVYKGSDGKPLPRETINEITQFQSSNRKTGCIDVWWLYDDGGLTLLLPYILTTRAQYSNCSLRVFALANKKDELDRETRKYVQIEKFFIDSFYYILLYFFQYGCTSCQVPN